MMSIKSTFLIIATPAQIFQISLVGNQKQQFPLIIHKYVSKNLCKNPLVKVLHQLPNEDSSHRPWTVEKHHQEPRSLDVRPRYAAIFNDTA